MFAVLLCCAVAGAAAGQLARPTPLNTIPTDFPKDCPIIANATFRDYQPAVRNRTVIGRILILDTPATPEAVLAFYKQALPANGWSVLKHPKREGDLIEATKGDRRVIYGIVATHQGANPTTTFRLVVVGKK
ncbi:MAG: hypothetical protein ABSH46_16900 [Bryobacteraceae bacterium]|jgi:hypothetical protein